MAIVVEGEEKKQSHMFAIAGWFVFLAVAAAGAYFVFFAPVVAEPIPASGGLSGIAPLAQSPVQPQNVENSSALTSLHTTIPAPTSTQPAAVGRTNPFIAP